MSEEHTLAKRIDSAERQIRWLRLLCGAQLAILILVAAAPAASRQILHARGLIIDDAQGRPRILIGAPFPSVKARHRQDPGSTAMIFLDPNGNDRLLVGEGIGAQIAGKVYTQQNRSVHGAAYGINVMDGSGNERGGFGFIATPSGGGRAVIALDRPAGDAWGAMVDDRLDFAGMLFNYPMPAGQYQSAIEIGVQGERPFLHFKDKEDNSRAEIAMAPDGTPSFTVSDAKGTIVKNVLTLAPPPAR